MSNIQRRDRIVAWIEDPEYVINGFFSNIKIHTSWEHKLSGPKEYVIKELRESNMDVLNDIVEDIDINNDTSDVSIFYMELMVMGIIMDHKNIFCITLPSVSHPVIIATSHIFVNTVEAHGSRVYIFSAHAYLGCIEILEGTDFYPFNACEIKSLSLMPKTVNESSNMMHLQNIQIYDRHFNTCAESITLRRYSITSKGYSIDNSELTVLRLNQCRLNDYLEIPRSIIELSLNDCAQNTLSMIIFPPDILRLDICSEFALSEYEFNMISKITNLRDITLENINNTIIPETLFSLLRKLETITIKSTSIRSLPSTLFRGLLNLNTIVINDNVNMINLPSDLFAGLPHIETVIINGSII